MRVFQQKESSWSSGGGSALAVGDTLSSSRGSESTLLGTATASQCGLDPWKASS